MHNEILTENQQELLPLLKSFASEFYLVGGTAIALQIGHRRSIDFDLFANHNIKRINIKRKINLLNFSIQEVLYEAFDQYHIIVNSVKMTFFNFPYQIPPQLNFNNIIKLPSLLDLAAMKAFALGGRAKWKDYVDLYFLLSNNFNLRKVSQRSSELFGAEFNEKLFREQLAYFDDIDYSEKIDYLNKNVKDSKIQKFLTDASLSPF